MDFISRWLTGSFIRPRPTLPTMRLGPEGSSQNPLMIQFFTWHCLKDDMSWWKHLEMEIPQLAEMGFTQVWLPPVNKAMDKHGRGYDAYDLWDLGEFDQKGTIATRWGTRKDLLDAAAAAHRHGVDLLVDAIINHKLGGDSLETFPAIAVDPTNRLKELGKVHDIDSWTCFNFPGRAGKYSALRWTHEHFNGVDFDNRTHTRGIFRVATEKHKGWSPYVDKEMGNCDYLLGNNIDHQNPETQEDLIAWGTWIIETLGATGFRIDAAKHIHLPFLLDFMRRTKEQTGMPKLFIVAECCSERLSNIVPYVHSFEGQAAFFDVPLHYHFFHASNDGSRYDLRKIFDDTLVKLRPDDAVTYVDNHDTVPGQTVQSWVEKCFKLQAYAIILLRGYGHPCVFYGDLYPNHENYDEATAEGLKTLIDIRKRYAYGRTVDYFAHRNCIGFVRLGEGERPGCVVVLTNGPTRHAIWMNVGKRMAENSTYRSLIRERSEVIVTKDGRGLFACPPNGVQVWVRETGTRG